MGMEVTAQTMRKYANEEPWIDDQYEKLENIIIEEAYYGGMKKEVYIPKEAYEKISKRLKKKGFNLIPRRDANLNYLVSWDEKQTCTGRDCAYCIKRNTVAKIIDVNVQTNLYCTKKDQEPVYEGVSCPLCRV